MAKNDAAPIIIKRKKVSGGHEHHGGAWKVAYADFVTAMMAFFLLMWLLNATTDEQRMALAEYFTPTISISATSGGGDGALGGDSVLTEETLAHNGKGATSRHPTEENAARGDTGSVPVEGGDTGTGPGGAGLETVNDMLRATAGEARFADDLLEHVNTRMTDEGLVIELLDREDMPLFRDNAPTPRLIALSDLVGSVLRLLINPVAVAGRLPEDGTGWGEGAARTDAVRALLESGGLPAPRIARLTTVSQGDATVVITVLRTDLPR
ncbi:flagellar motor protein MotB [Pontivivens ytuae]|uniref:Chemotaxis protein MotB n=1 Tax=Pontivivens ytuae TaxID=2789856 RepID=A0A7S9QBP5_9RHOB|nr:flagellar motor protein MotB [Pontivivens ytuae]QPH53108.1 chemotaxis protein MotB [Pontivivens ytuae]